MKKENKKPLILWALVALVLGVILGLVITNLSTTGQAKSAVGLDSGRQESDIQEDRRDLRANNLYINKIYRNTENPQNASIGFGSNIKSETGFYWGKYENSTAFTVSPNTGSVDNGNSEITIKAPLTIGASTKFNQLVNDVEVPWGLYGVGDSFTANTYLITVLEILDANNTVVLNFAREDDTSTDYYATEGEIILGLIEVGPIDSSFVQLRVILSGNAYACLTADGTLYRSYNPCN